jgi:hypothetical protein
MKIINRIFCLFIVFGISLAVQNPWRAGAQSGEIQVFLPVTYNRFNAGPGIVAGKVIDASSGLPFSGSKVAKVCYEDNCTKTDEAGMFQFTNIPAGAQYFHASADNYYFVGMWFNIIAYQENQLNIVMSQNLSISKVKMRIVTTWSTNPCWPIGVNPPCAAPSHENDLDGFLWVTTAGITPTLVKDVSRTQCTSYPYACKENDARQGTGPETIAIQDFKAGSNYYYGVLNYNQYQPDVPLMSVTEASVGVYNEQGLMDTFSVPDKGDGNFWYVFSMDDTGVIHAQNCIIQLSPSAGTLPDCGLQPARRIQKMPKKPKPAFYK